MQTQYFKDKVVFVADNIRIATVWTIDGGYELDWANLPVTGTELREIVKGITTYMNYVVAPVIDS